MHTNINKKKGEEYPTLSAKDPPIIGPAAWPNPDSASLIPTFYS